MKVRHVSAILVCLMLILTAITSVSVYATWNYAGMPVGNQNHSLGLGMNEFVYRPEEVLPDDEYDELGQNHMQLIDNILNVAKYGLNETQKPILHEVLADDGIVYGNQNVQGGNLKHITIDVSAEAKKLMYAIEFISETEYMTYTFVYADITTKSIGTYVHVFKTQMTKENGVWDAVRSWEGEAQINSPGTVSRSIDVKSWRET